MVGELHVVEKFATISLHPLISLLLYPDQLTSLLSAAFNGRQFSLGKEGFAVGTAAECMYITMHGTFVLENLAEYFYRGSLSLGADRVLRKCKKSTGLVFRERH